MDTGWFPTGDEELFLLSALRKSLRIIFKIMTRLYNSTLWVLFLSLQLSLSVSLISLSLRLHFKSPDWVISHDWPRRCRGCVRSPFQTRYWNDDHGGASLIPVSHIIFPPFLERIVVPIAMKAWPRHWPSPFPFLAADPGPPCQTLQWQMF